MELADVTREKAEVWLERNIYEYQRALKPRFVSQYADEMTKGHFKDFTVIEFAHLDGQMFLMDGQHRLAGIKKSGMTLPLYVQHRYYKNVEDIAADYARTDYGKIRSWSDIINALHAALGIQDRLILADFEFNALKSAFELIYRGFMSDGVKSDRVMLYEKTLEWQHYARAYFDAIGNNRRDNVCMSLQRKHLVAMGICTMRFSDFHLPEDRSAFDFWRQVSFDDGIGMYDPRKKLREILYNSRVVSTPSQAKNFTQKDLLLYATKAWDNYCEGTEIKRLVFPRNPVVQIRHTPFDSSKTISEYRTAFESADWGENWPSV